MKSTCNKLSNILWEIYRIGQTYWVFLVVLPDFSAEGKWCEKNSSKYVCRFYILLFFILGAVAVARLSKQFAVQ